MSKAQSRLVYIVEDDDDVRSSTRALLETCGYDVREFASGEQVLAADNVYEAGCIVLDYHLSGMSGLDLLERLRVQGIHAPAIIVSASAKLLITRALQAGVIAVLRKPMAADTLEHWLQQVLPPPR